MGFNSTGETPFSRIPASRSATSRSTIFRIAIFLIAVSITGCAAEQTQSLSAKDEFFNRLSAMCGRTYQGASTFPMQQDDPMYGRTLTITFQDCSEQEIRVPFHVGEDTSRTWLIMRMPDALTLMHDHRDEHGMPHPPTHYGGTSDDGGTGHRQSFPANQETVVMIPPAATNVWTLEIDTLRQLFIYDLHRDGKPRFRAEFQL